MTTSQRTGRVHRHLVLGKGFKETSKDPAIQILHAYKYIRARYETPCEAMRFHLRHNYY
jgi:hypothetical protein